MKGNVCLNARTINLTRMEFVKDVIFLINNVQNVLRMDVKIVKKDFIRKRTLANIVLLFWRVVHCATRTDALLVKMEKSY